MATCATCGTENPDDARFCNACGTELRRARRGGGEERKVVTVVFVDLIGFTAQAERLDPEDVRGVLEPYHARARDELERRGGTVEKFIGDAVVAVFGAPIAHEDDPERAVRAALAIRDWAAAQPGLQVRLAVNTGEALVALGARAAQGEAIVAGDVVNTAARMQAGAPVNGVLVGETTRRATRDAIRYRAAAPLLAKGKTAPVDVFEAVEALAPHGAGVAARPTTPLVGRHRELELLRSVLARALDERAAQVVTILGVPGIGKSRLVRELRGLVEGAPEPIAWLTGRCLPYGESVTFWALGEIVKAECGILETDTAADADAKVRAATARLVPDASEQRWLEMELRALVGVGDGEGRMTGETAQAAWRRFLEAIAERGPTVLVFEDLHWADDGLLDFLDDLVDWLRGVPLLVVGTARPELVERRPGWGGGKADATSISLQPLGDDDTAHLVSALLGRPLQLADDRGALLERAGGNPLFAEQYVRMLQERGTTSTMPESVQGVIAARLDALPRDEKELLQEAAVHGRVFWLGGVAATAGIATAEAARLLRALERKDFVRRQARSMVAGDTEYAFQHALVRDGAYGQLPRRARAERHRRAGDWIAELGRAEDHAELSAYHYQQALQLGRAAGVADDPALVEATRRWLRRGGERALRLAAYATAASFFADALALADPSDPERPSLLVLRARAVFPIGGAGGDLLAEALEGFRAMGDAEGTAEAATLAVRYAWFAGDRAATDRFMGVALDAIAERPPSRAAADALTSKVGYLLLAGSFDEAIRVGAEALPLVEALGLDEQRARLHSVVGCARCCLGDRGGLDEIRAGIDVAEAAGAVDMRALGYANLSAELHFFGLLADARRASQQYAELAEQYRLHRLLRTVRAEAASWAYLDGRWDEAVELAGEAAARVDRDGHVTDPIALALRGHIRLARGDVAGADRDTRLAAELAHASDLQAQAAAYPIRAAVALANGDRAEANELASALVALGPAIVGALCSPFPSLTDVAWVFRDLGRQRELREAVLDPDPIRSPWNDAAQAILDDDFAGAADIIDGIGHTAAAAYARLRAAEASAAAGDAAAAAAQRALADGFPR